MTTFFTSDTHIGHVNIIILGEGRPFVTINEHDETLIRNFQNVMTNDDILYHLGDVALGQFDASLPKIDRMPGEKYLVPGNHDRVSTLEPEPRRNRFMPAYLEVFEDVLEEWVDMTLPDGTEVVLSHYPYHGDSHGKDRHIDMRPKDEGKILIHGHTHSKNKVSRSPAGTLMISVGVDAWDYKPVSVDQIIEIIQKES